MATSGGDDSVRGSFAQRSLSISSSDSNSKGTLSILFLCFALQLLKRLILRYAILRYPRKLGGHAFSPPTNLLKWFTTRVT